MKKIKSLKSLNEWNNNPTKKLPDLHSWYFDYFFDELLMKGKIDLAKEAYNSYVRFCKICNNFNKKQAEDRLNRNLGYYAGYSAKWTKILKKHFPSAKHPVLS